MLTLVSSLVPFTQAGINFHIYPFLTDQGFGETTAIWILTAVAVSGMAGSALWGGLAERFRIQGLLTANIIGGSLIFLLFFFVVSYRVDSPFGIGLVFLLAGSHGIFHGGRIPMVSIAWANFFGRRSLGSIYSVGNAFWYAGNAIGPVFAAFCFDLFGNYAFPFYVFVAVFLFSSVMTARMKHPRHPAHVPA